MAEAAFVDGYVRRVVLHRPAPATAAALARAEGRWVLAEEGRLTSEQGTFAVSRFIAGWDADALAEARIPARPLLELLREIVRGLAEAARVGVPHGALTGGSVRITPSGAVHLVGFRGEGADDLEALAHLAGEWVDASGHPIQGLDSALQGSLEQVEAALSAKLEAADGPPLAEWVRSLPTDPPPWMPHPLKGSTLVPSGAPDPVPQKVRVATIAALTMVFGLAAGAILFGGGPSSAVEVRCGEHRMTAEGAGLRVEAPGCEVFRSSER